MKKLWNNNCVRVDNSFKNTASLKDRNVNYVDDIVPRDGFVLTHTELNEKYYLHLI